MRLFPLKSTRRIVLALLISALVALGLAVATPAQATPRPPIPTGVHVTAATTTGFTVALNATPYAQTYRLFASATRTNVHIDEISLAQASAVSTSPNLTISGMSPVAGPISYRVYAYNPGRSPTYSDIYTTYLRPATPTNLHITSTSAGEYLTWTWTAQAYAVDQATNATMTENRRTYIVRGPANQFTPYDLSENSTYYFRLRAMNGTTPSSYSLQVSARPVRLEHDLSVMTYNIRSIDAGSASGSETVSPWSSRVGPAAALIQSVRPDVIGIQEGSSWVGAVKGPRQVDDLLTHLGSDYAMARTEVPPTESGYRRYGNYILYKAKYIQTVGAGGQFDIGDGRYAAYQVLRSRSTGASFLFVTTHAIPGAGATYDNTRETETKTMMTAAGAYASARHLPVVYAGDFNSDLSSQHSFDGSGVAMMAAKYSDAFVAARFTSNAQYDSGNLYERTPAQAGFSIDHIYTSPGVSLRSWREIMDLSGGKFVGVIPSDHNPVMSDLVIPY